MTFDLVFKEVGNFGKYQKYVVTICNLTTLQGALLFLNSFFTLYVPAHRCAIPHYDNDTFAVQNKHHQMLINMTIPLHSDEKLPYDACHVFPVGVDYAEDNRPVNASAVRCERWVYDDSVFQHTLGAKLNLVCDRKVYKSSGQMVFYAGVFVGSLVSGFASDRFGRKPTFLTSLVVQIAASLALAWTPNYAFYVIFRFIVGATNITGMISAIVLGMEFVGPSDRKIPGVLGNYAWVAGTLLLAGLGYGIRNWHHLQLACALPGILFLSYFWLLPESPRWLLSRGRLEECDAIVRRIARYNNITLPADMLSKLAEETTEEGCGQFWQVFKSRILCVRMVILFVNWSVINMAYYGLALNSGNLGGDMFLNFALIGLMDLPASVLVLVLLDKTGRKPLHVTCMVVGGLVCLSTVLSTHFGVGKDLTTLTVVLAMVGKMGVFSAYTVIYVYTGELYPTVVRNTGMGASSCVARVGGMLAPYIADIENLVGDGGLGKALPMVLFGVMTIAAGVLTLLLPETQKKPLPETIQDAKLFGRRNRKVEVSSERSTPEELILDDTAS